MQCPGRHDATTIYDEAPPACDAADGPAALSFCILKHLRVIIALSYFAMWMDVCILYYIRNVFTRDMTNTKTYKMTITSKMILLGKALLFRRAEICAAIDKNNESRL